MSQPAKSYRVIDITPTSRNQGFRDRIGRLIFSSVVVTFLERELTKIYRTLCSFRYCILNRPFGTAYLYKISTTIAIGMCQDANRIPNLRKTPTTTISRDLNIQLFHRRHGCRTNLINLLLALHKHRLRNSGLRHH